LLICRGSGKKQVIPCKKADFSRFWAKKTAVEPFGDRRYPAADRGSPAESADALPEFVIFQKV